MKNSRRFVCAARWHLRNISKRHRVCEVRSFIHSATQPNRARPNKTSTFVPQRTNDPSATDGWPSGLSVCVRRPSSPSLQLQIDKHFKRSQSVCREIARDETALGARERKKAKKKKIHQSSKGRFRKKGSPIFATFLGGHRAWFRIAVPGEARRDVPQLPSEKVGVFLRFCSLFCLCHSLRHKSDTKFFFTTLLLLCIEISQNPSSPFICSAKYF